jgi:hypothetical protein
MINAKKYYYLAILPNKEVPSGAFKSKFEEVFLNQDVPMDIENVRCAYWGDIEKFFKDIKEDPNNDVIKNFNYNKCKGKKISQIYN